MPETAAAARRILVVDDDDALRHLLQVLLESDGYTVVTASTTQEALAALREGPPDLVLCDVRLPDAPPFALVDHLASDLATMHLPLVVCSGAVREIEQAGERLARPHLAVLLKPFDIDALLATVARLLTSTADTVS